MKKLDIENVLDELRIPLNIKGYQYLIDAVITLDENEKIKVTDLYQIVAEKQKTTKSRVERAIRHSYQRDVEPIKKYFNFDCKLTNHLLICAIQREVKRKVGE